MNADQDRLALAGLTSKMIGCVYAVSNTLAGGLLEKMDQNAWLIELHHSGLPARLQHPFAVHYNGSVVGEYYVDFSEQTSDFRI